MATNLSTPRSKDEVEAKQAPVPECLYVKVSMDGAPYLRKVDLKMYKNYKELSLELEKKFSCFTVGELSFHPLPFFGSVVAWDATRSSFMFCGIILASVCSIMHFSWTSAFFTI
jgi:hypothetical protein